MAAKQIQCPNCGATISKDDLKGLQCPYCGSKIENVVESRERTNRKSYQFDGIIPFSRSEEEARQTLAWELANDTEIPIDVFHGLSISTKKVFVPTWWFAGTFKAPWSCQKIVERRREYIENGETKRDVFPVIKDYHAASGVAVGKFHFCISASKEEDLFVPLSKSLPFSLDLLDDDAQVLSFDLDKEKAWNNPQIESDIAFHAKMEVEKQLPSKYEDLSTHNEYSYKQCESLLYPVWVAEFEYEGTTYRNKVSGCYGNVIGNIDAPYKEVEEEQHDDKDAFDETTIYGFGCIGGLLFVVGVVITGVAAAWSFTLPAIVGGLLAFACFFFAFDLYVQTNRQKEMRKHLRYEHEESELEKRHRMLWDEPLLQSYRREMTVTSEYDRYLTEYKSKIKSDKNRERLYYRIVVTLAVVAVVAIVYSLIARFLFNRDDSPQHEEVTEQIQTYNEALEAGMVLPNMIFNKDLDGAGHSRQDLRTKLLHLGYVKSHHESSNYSATSRNIETYALSDTDGSEVAWIYINGNVTTSNMNSQDEIQTIAIEVNEMYAETYYQKFKTELSNMGICRSARCTTQRNWFVI